MTVGTYTTDYTEGGTNGLLFATGTAATIANATKGYLYNNSGTLTWVNSGADTQLALNIPASASAITGQTITVNDTQTDAQKCLVLSTGTSNENHTALQIGMDSA